MNLSDATLIFIFFALLLSVAPYLGYIIARIFLGKMPRALLAFEGFIYRILGTDPQKEMGWKKYALSLLVFNLLGGLTLFLVLIFQGFLPLNPESFQGMPLFLAANTAISFMTNTNWQAYVPETSLSYFSQMIGLGVQNFLSAATGLCVFVALSRGLTRKNTQTIGNYWQDLTRSVLFILLPLSFILGLFLIAEGVIQNFSSYLEYTSLEGVLRKLPMGPAASQIAIKQIGSNGGGFFAANSAHPFENPTSLSNFLQLMAILLIPFALPFTYGFLTGQKKHGFVLFAAMLALFIAFLASSLFLESRESAFLHLPFIEGKETRFGTAASTLWMMATTATSNGSVNAMISSASPLTSGLCLLQMLLGEVIFGGVGCGMYGLVLFVLLTVFLAGLMVGRTPEYLGKKIEDKEIKSALVGVLLPSFCILVFAGAASVLQVGLVARLTDGPHGLSEILYAFASSANNNGSAFGGLTADGKFYLITTGICMLIGRFGVLLPVLYLAGSFARKNTTPPSAGSLPTDTLLFGVLLIAIILIMGGLTFFPPLILGPLAEFLLVI